MSIDNTTNESPFVAPQYGLIGGVLLVAMLFGVYMLNPDLLTNISLLLVIHLILVAFMLVTANSARKLNNGLIDFKGALRNAFGVAALALFIFTVFYYILYTFIDPNLIVLFKNKMVAFNVDFLKSHGASESEINKRTAEIEFQYSQFGISFFMQFFAGNVIVSFFYSLIVGAVFNFAFKNNRTHTS